MMMTINTRGGGVTHTHTHIPDKGQQCSLVLIQSRLVRWLVVCFIVRRVCVCPLYWVRTARVRVSVGWLCIRQKKRVALSPIHTHTIYTHIHTGRDGTAHKMVCAVLSLACVCVRVCCCCCGVRLRWGRNVVGIVSVVVAVAAVAAAAAAADMIPRLFIHIVVVVW